MAAYRIQRRHSRVKQRQRKRNLGLDWSFCFPSRFSVLGYSGARALYSNSFPFFRLSRSVLFRCGFFSYGTHITSHHIHFFFAPAFRRGMCAVLCCRVRWSCGFAREQESKGAKAKARAREQDLKSGIEI